MRNKIIFPPVETANEHGLVAVGGDLEIDTLLSAYRQGIFPWPVNMDDKNINLPMTWFSPDPRGVLDFKNLHLSRSFKKFLKHTPLKVTFNKNFSGVIDQCAKTLRRDHPVTWISPKIRDSYTKLFDAGYAYSVEVWDEEILVAGIYGVAIGSFISGESMFTHTDNASKQGLYYLVRHLESKGLSWIDTQMVTTVVEQFGGRYISRREFLNRLKEINWNIDRDHYFHP
jgi:leucyl/phenylalanyl-tRNA--protein transferase